MSDELKPCPFCGGEDVLSEGVVDKGWLHCSDCGAFGPHPSYDMLTPKPEWNTRAAPKVKELVWEPQEIARLATPGTYLTVETHLGCYELHQFEYRNGRVSGWMLRTPATADLIGFDREADAKDAAQADYKRRALSCFEGANDGEM